MKRVPKTGTVVPKPGTPLPYCIYVVAHDNPDRPDRKRFCGAKAVWWESRCQKHVTAPEPREQA